MGQLRGVRRIPAWRISRTCPTLAECRGSSMAGSALAGGLRVLLLRDRRRWPCRLRAAARRPDTPRVRRTSDDRQRADPARRRWPGPPTARTFIAEKDGALKVAAPGRSHGHHRARHLGACQRRRRPRPAGRGGGQGLRHQPTTCTCSTPTTSSRCRRTATARTVSRLLRFTLNPRPTTVASSQVLLGSYVRRLPARRRNDLDCIPSDDLSHSIGTVGRTPRRHALGRLRRRRELQRRRPAGAAHLRRAAAWPGRSCTSTATAAGLTGHSFCPSDDRPDQVCTKLYAKGFRNPFRFTLRPDGRRHRRRRRLEPRARRST